MLKVKEFQFNQIIKFLLFTVMIKMLAKTSTIFFLQLGLSTFLMKSDARASNTIIEELEKNIEISGFGIVLLTPDDWGYSNQENEEEKKPRARQNVILEMGMLLGKLGRKKIAILVKGVVEKPSDIDGILYLEYNSTITEKGNALITRLKQSGFKITDEASQKAMDVDN